MNRTLTVIIFFNVLIISLLTYGCSSVKRTSYSKVGIVKVKLYEPSTYHCVPHVGNKGHVSTSCYGHHERWNISFLLEDNNVINKNSKDLFISLDVNDKVEVRGFYNKTHWFGTITEISSIEKVK